MHTRWTKIKQTDSEKNHNLKIGNYSENSKMYRGKHVEKLHEIWNQWIPMSINQICMVNQGCLSKNFW